MAEDGGMIVVKFDHETWWQRHGTGLVERGVVALTVALLAMLLATWLAPFKGGGSPPPAPTLPPVAKDDPRPPPTAPPPTESKQAKPVQTAEPSNRPPAAIDGLPKVRQPASRTPRQAETVSPNALNSDLLLEMLRSGNERQSLSFATSSLRAQISKGFHDAQLQREPMLWNYWLESRAQPQALPKPDNGVLPMNQQRALQFRLGMLDLSRLVRGTGRLEGAATLGNAVEASVNDERLGEMQVIVLVQSVGERALEVAPASRRQTLRIDLETLRRQLRDGQPTYRSIDEALTQSLLTQFEVRFTLRQPGRHDLSVAVVDAATGFPLQSFVARLQAGQPWPGNLEVRGAGQRPMADTVAKHDLVLLLSRLSSSGTALPTDRLFATLLHRQPDGTAVDVIQWRTELDVAGLLRQARSFREAPGLQQDAEALRQAGAAMGLLLFSPEPDISSAAPLAADANLDAAERARRLILQQAAYAPGALPPSLAVSLANLYGGAGLDAGLPVFPFGALGVSEVEEGQTRTVFLGERFALSVLVPDLQAPPGDACPPSWYVAIPDASVQDKALRDTLASMAERQVDWLRGPGVVRQTAALCPLRDWLRPGLPAECAKPPVDEDDNGMAADGAAKLIGARNPTNAANPGAGTPQVLLYLGHHVEDQLYLNRDAGRLYTGNLRRDFGGGSIAILNACTSAAENISRGSLLGHLLMNRHLSAAVVTTSQVSSDLAAAYMDCLSRTLKSRSGLTIGQAQALTTQCLWAATPAQPGVAANKGFGGAALKYLLYGNSAQKICAPKPRSAS